ncbi:hypothetical protein CHLNCDRAFT_23425 [Chlorella variabilis]|uniref:Uncharacterized protein n=1 Tax=Chlorella variabilis TaxID=554065 RepID=E1ZFQ4_CHLVA|nr:hypothetical protein CHLNCDRAFT_23425 [Chlorella variabilis]EFN55320.1 hypothetical protein CHLNCDRAFT_23425 [Chlorella variabilis]|eukprot:XP_005847422.1 hypothetical protein CHLNCDRAFT_23425 [Chlorella variabilis]
MRTRRNVLTPTPPRPQVRNLVEHAGLEVRTLRRVRIGGYRMPRDLAFGQFVELRPHEVRRVLNVGADRTM